jgi:hypothetical protein
VWNQKKNWMIIVLSLNVIDVFDTMSHASLIHDVRKRKISKWIIDWINKFFSDRFTTLAVNRRMIVVFSIQTRTFQSSSFFFILYLFYNADLLKMCNKLDTNTRS